MFFWTYVSVWAPLWVCECLSSLFVTIYMQTVGILVSKGMVVFLLWPGVCGYNLWFKIQAFRRWLLSVAPYKRWAVSDWLCGYNLLLFGKAFIPLYWSFVYCKLQGGSLAQHESKVKRAEERFLVTHLQRGRKTLEWCHAQPIAGAELYRNIFSSAAHSQRHFNGREHSMPHILTARSHPLNVTRPAMAREVAELV